MFSLYIYRYACFTHIKQNNVIHMFVTHTYVNHSDFIYHICNIWHILYAIYCVYHIGYYHVTYIISYISYVIYIIDVMCDIYYVCVCV